MQDRNRQSRGGFTLMELMVVISIVAMLVAIMSVGTRHVRIIGQGIQQKSEFHAMRVGLELFSGDFDGYPDSALTSNGGAAPYVTGAQHLAEALLGRDLRGFEPQTGWYPPNDSIYRSTVPDDLYDTLTPTSRSLPRRRGPYCELKYGGAYSIHELWQGQTAGSIYTSASAVRGTPLWSPVITDVFTRTLIDVPNPNPSAPAGSMTTARVGSPVLYFKADPSKLFRVDANRQNIPDNAYEDDIDFLRYNEWVYNYRDNLPILNLPWMRDPIEAVNHYTDPENAGRTRARMFYEQITKVADADRGFYQPHNNSTFILISAGWDGVFGTRHDILSFE